MNEEIETVVNNEYDYSNMVASGENIATIVQYCETLFNQFNSLIARDEKKNEMLKYEFKSYEYAKHFKSEFTVILKQRGLNNIICKNYNAYMDALKSGNVNNLNGLDIILDLSYKRGNSGDLKEYRNDFKIIFRPYDIRFIRKSNHNETTMNQIEDAIKFMLNQFPVANTIFFNK